METVTGGDWFGVNDAIKHLDISRKTLYKWIKDGKLTSEKREQKRFIWIDDVTETLKETKKNTGTKQGDSNLNEQVEYFKNKVDALELELSEQRKRHDAIILQMTQQNQLLLAQASKPFWKFW